MRAKGFYMLLDKDESKSAIKQR